MYYLLSSNTDVLEPPGELTYFDIMPIEILINIFNNLELTDVIIFENFSQQTEEAAISYYRRRFSKFHLNSSSLLSLAHCNQQQEAEAVLRVI